MALTLHILASGSKGNASIVADSETGRAVLIDCGISRRAFFNCCSEVGFDPSGIEAVLITHEHIDHTKGLGVVLRGLQQKGINPRIYASDLVMRASREIGTIRDSFDFVDMRDESSFAAAGLTVNPFLTSHDVTQSFGFRIEDEKGDGLGFLTDSGFIPEAARAYLENCRILALESNYDQRMLETGHYPQFLKQRIMSDNGHLSNAQAAEALESLLSSKLESVVAMHISENNNTYVIPRTTLAEAIERNTHPAVALTSYQYRVTSVS